MNTSKKSATKNSFHNQVYELVKTIPKGKVTTYKEIAHVLHSKAYRAVGSALAKNPHKDVCCHRVIKSDRSIGGYYGSMSEESVKKKMSLLKQEGVQIHKQQVRKEDIYVF